MRICALSLLACAALPGVEFTYASLGGSPTPIGAGARALGMGGAFSAIADDATAATWNPAGMAQLERPELGASGGWYHQRAESDARDTTSDEWKLDHLGGVLPFYAFGVQQAVGLSWQRQFDLTASVAFGDSDRVEGATPFTVDQRFDFERAGGYAAWSASYAAAVGDRINLGLTLNLWSDELTFDSGSEGELRSVNEVRFDSGLSITSTNQQRVEETVEDGLSVVLGAQWRVAAPLTLALVVKPGYELEIDQRVSEHELQLRRTNPGDAPTVDRDERSTTRSGIEREFPSSATLAAAWHVDDARSLALDLTWTRWSEYTTTRQGQQVSAFSDLLDPDEVDDDFALRLGYEHLFILPRWVIAWRAGAQYERIPGLAPEGELSVRDDAEATTEDWFGLSTGLSAFRRRVSYDFALRLRWGQDVGAGVYAPIDETADVLDLTVRAGVGVYF